MSYMTRVHEAQASIGRAMARKWLKDTIRANPYAFDWEQVVVALEDVLLDLRFTMLEEAWDEAAREDRARKEVPR